MHARGGVEKGVVISGRFSANQSFASSAAFPRSFGKNYENEHILTVGKQEGSLRWLRLQGYSVSEEKRFSSEMDYKVIGVYDDFPGIHPPDTTELVSALRSATEALLHGQPQQAD
jgi:hypothetical protein